MEPIRPVDGAYHGMVQAHPDDAPLLGGPQEAVLNDEDTPFKTTEDSIRDALRAAQDALDQHRRARLDMVERNLQLAVDSLKMALLTGGGKCC